MMRLAERGEVAPGLFATGPHPVPIFVAPGESPVVFDAGITAFAPIYRDAVADLLGESASRAVNLLTHVHWDHCGGASFLRGSFPGLRTGSARAGIEFLANERHALQVRRLNLVPDVELAFEAFVPELTLHDGQTFRVSRDLTVVVIATPGHTRDSVSFHLPEIGAVVTGDTLGTPGHDGRISSEFLADYDAYRRSLERLERLRPRVICLGHTWVCSGDDARAYVGRALRDTDGFRARLERLLVQEEGRRQVVFQHVKAADYDPVPEPKQPEVAYGLNLRAQIATIAGRMRRQMGLTDASREAAAPAH